ncbi:unnamed protein product [Rhizophagus irregularis]|nr:unnamed protein product [Rhizophagus irregularis]
MNYFVSDGLLTEKTKIHFGWISIENYKFLVNFNRKQAKNHKLWVDFQGRKKILRGNSQLNKTDLFVHLVPIVRI